MVSLDAVNGRKLVMGYIGMILVIIGIATLLPLVMLIPFNEEWRLAWRFILPSGVAICTGIFMSSKIKGKKKGNLDKYQSATIVTCSWLLAIFVSAWPFLLGGDYTFTQAIFESTSGWSTTGLSIVDVEAESHLILFHRSLTMFFGGVGLVLVMLSFLTDSYGMRLYYAEGHPDELLPNLIQSSRLIMKMYIIYIGSGAILYIIFGMNWFDAINHSITAIATGGFSTKAESIGYYHSFPIELITMGLMLIGATNFVAVLYLAKRKIKNFFRYCEVKFTFLVIAFFIPLVCLMLCKFGNYNLIESIRVSAFHVISAFSTTGFQIVPSFMNWHGSIVLPLVLLMLIGGQSGSTAGGIKQYRMVILFKSMYWTIRDNFSDDHFIRANYVKKPEDDEFITTEQRNSVHTFVAVYLLVFIAGSILLCGLGCGLDDALFEISSAMGGVGLSSGITSPTANPAILWTLTCGMFVGRLEIYVVIIAIVNFFRS